MEYLIIVLIFLSVGLVFSRNPYLSQHSGGSIILGVIIVLVIAALIVERRKRLKTRCPSCKRSWALKLTETNFLYKEDISILVELKHKDIKGQVIETSEQYIPGIRNAYESFYQCKYCGNRIRHTYNIDKKKV